MKGNIPIGISDSETGTDEGAVNEDGRDLTELFLSLDVTFLFLRGQSLNAAQETLDERRARVDFKHLLLLRKLPHMFVVHLSVRRA